VSEHSARQADPGQFDKFRRQNDAGGSGVHFIYGIKSGKSQIQAVRFSSDKFSVSEAKSWLVKHKMKTSVVAATGDDKDSSDHDEGATATASTVSVPVALRNLSVQYRPKNFSEPGQSWKQEIGETSEGWKLYLVDGQYVRDHFDTDYVEGGHWLVYKWIPQHEIWIEKLQTTEDIEMSSTHEIIEAKLMELEGLDYETAHARTIELESLIRKVGEQAESK
jgi:hypothetical protein